MSIKTSMGVVTYRPVDIIRWLGQSRKKDRKAAVGRALSVPQVAVDKGLVKGIQNAAESAFGLGKQAFKDLDSSKAEELSYTLFEEGFEVVGLMKRVKVDYTDISSIVSRGSDKYRVFYSGGHVSVRPVAHLVAGSLKVPIGWLRNGMEVEYDTLIQELAARAGRDIVEE
jgi:hypothetical protein